MAKKRKKLSVVRFSNGAKFVVSYVKDPPQLAAEDLDHILVEMIPEKGRGEAHALYMNGYDVTNLVWALSGALVTLTDKNIPAHGNLKEGGS